MKNKTILNSEFKYSNYTINLNLINTGENEQVLISLKNSLTDREYEKSNLRLKDLNNAAIPGESRNALDFFNSFNYSVRKNLEESRINEIKDNDSKESAIYNPYNEALFIDENEDFSKAFFSFNYFPHENSLKEFVRIELPILGREQPAPTVMEDKDKNENNHKAVENRQSKVDNINSEAKQQIVSDKNKRILVKNALKKLLLLFPLLLGVFYYINPLGSNKILNKEENCKQPTTCDSSITVNVSDKHQNPSSIKDKNDVKESNNGLENEDKNKKKSNEVHAKEKIKSYTAKEIINEFSHIIEAEALNDFDKLIKTFCKQIKMEIHNFDLLFGIKRKNISNFLKNYESIKIFKNKINNKPYLLYFISFYYRGNLNSIGIYQEKVLSEINKILTVKDEKSFIIDATTGKLFKANKHAEYNIRNHKNYFFQFGNTNNYDGISIDKKALYIANTNQFNFDEEFKAKKRINIQNIIDFKIFTFKK